jgi:hypothetical protein
MKIYSIFISFVPNDICSVFINVYHYVTKITAGRAGAQRPECLTSTPEKSKKIKMGNKALQEVVVKICIVV